MRVNSYIFSNELIKLRNMSSTTKLPTSFYEHVGGLFYAIAAIDHSVKKEEVESLKQCLESFWNLFGVTGEDPSLKPEDLLEEVFKSAVQNTEDPEKCFEEFAEYRKTHSAWFSIPVNKAIWKTANAIANSFAQVNKNEVILLQKLKLVLKAA